MEPTPSPEFDESFAREVAQDLDKTKKRTFTVSIMGQTGVGKTSLLKELFNKVLFNQNILVDHVRPATRRPETYTVTGEDGQTLTINDLPGIGESNNADQNHLDTYQKYFLPSDLVIWAIQADNRATTLDAQALGHLLQGLDDRTQEQFVSKMVFVLTKVDTLLPVPWVMAYSNRSVWFSPQKETIDLIEQKQEFFQEQLIEPFGSRIISLTYNDAADFSLGEPFSFDEKQITYHGLLTKRLIEGYLKDNPKYKNVFDRLYDNYLPVPCSARFKYNLYQLMLVILNKIDSNAVQNFKRIVDPNLLKNMSLDEARRLCNLLIWSTPDSRKIFDLEDGKFPDPRRDSVFYKRNVEQRIGLFRELFGLRKQQKPGRL